MTPRRAKEILESSGTMGGYVDKPTEEERKEVREVWDTLPGWACFNDALIAIATPLLRKEGACGYLVNRMIVIKRALKGKPFHPDYDFTP